MADSFPGSRLREDIRGCLVGLKSMDLEHFSATFVFPTGFKGFQGHFPGFPVLPGVCIVQTLLVLCEKARGTRLFLKEIVTAKFASSISPDQTVRVTCRFSEEGNREAVVRSQVHHNETKVAQLTLRVGW